MKLKYLILIIYLISSGFAYSTIKPDIKNLIIHKEKKKTEQTIFFDENNNKKKLEDYISNLVIVNFWATWCSPCREEMPSLNKISKLNSLSNLKVIPINIGEDRLEDSKNFFDELNIDNLRIFYGSSGELAKRFQLRGVPTTIIIDKKGFEVARIMGSIDFEEESFLNWLAQFN